MENVLEYVENCPAAERKKKVKTNKARGLGRRNGGKPKRVDMQEDVILLLMTCLTHYIVFFFK